MFIKVEIMHLGIYIFHIYEIDSKSCLQVLEHMLFLILEYIQWNWKVNSKISDIQCPKMLVVDIV